MRQIRPSAHPRRSPDPYGRWGRPGDAWPDADGHVADAWTLEEIPSALEPLPARPAPRWPYVVATAGAALVCLAVYARLAGAASPPDDGRASDPGVTRAAVQGDSSGPGPLDAPGLVPAGQVPAGQVPAGQLPAGRSDRAAVDAHVDLSFAAPEAWRGPAWATYGEAPSTPVVTAVLRYRLPDGRVSIVEIVARLQPGVTRALLTIPAGSLGTRSEEIAVARDATLAVLVPLPAPGGPRAVVSLSWVDPTDGSRWSLTRSLPTGR